MKRVMILLAVGALMSAVGWAGSAGLHYGHGIQLATLTVHYPTGDRVETGEWETITLRRSPTYPRHYFLAQVDWLWSDLYPYPHSSGDHCSVFSPLDLSAMEQ